MKITIEQLEVAKERAVALKQYAGQLTEQHDLEDVYDVLETAHEVGVQAAYEVSLNFDTLIREIAIMLMDGEDGRERFNFDN